MLCSYFNNDSATLVSLPDNSFRSFQGIVIRCGLLDKFVD